MERPNRLYELRRKAKISQTKLGVMLASGRSTIDKLEKGERELTIEWMERIATHLGCMPWDLLPEDKTPEQQETEIQLRFRKMGRDQREALLSVAKQMAQRQN